MVRPAKLQLIHRLMGAALALGVLLQPLALAASPGLITGDVRVTVTPANIHQSLPVSGADRLVNMSLYDVSLHDALRALASQGGFSVLIDESVTGNISVDLENVRLQDALETLKNYGNLAYSVDGSKLLVASADSERGQAFKRATTKVIPLKHANAKMLAQLLNTSVFSPPEGAANQQRPSIVTPDFHTNSLVVVGSPKDISTVEKHVAALDLPREVRTWRLSHADAVDVAAQLSASLFNEGFPALTMESGGGGGGAGGGAGGGGGGGGGQPQIMPSSLRVAIEKIEEGEGASEQSASGESQTTAGQITLRGRIKENQTVQVSPQGPILMPDSRLNSITLMGTAEQIAVAESLIATFDRKPPQVILEASLIEVSSTDTQNLGYRAGFNKGNFSFGANNLNAYTNAIGTVTDINENVLSWTTRPVRRTANLYYQLDALIQKEQAKLLANPTVVAAHDSETVISIVDEFIRSVEVTTAQLGGVSGTEVEISDYGVVLNILPRIGADGTVNMRIRPTISTLQSTPIVDPLGNETRLVSKREVVAQNVRLADGESFVLGGLVHESDTDAIARIPGINRLPILGALGRSSSKAKDRSELLIVITPHVINDESQAVRQTAHHPMRPAIIGKQQGEEPGFHPVSSTPLPYSTPSKLPPLQPVNVLGGQSLPQSMLMKSAPEEAKPDEMKTPAPEPAALAGPQSRPFNVKAGGPVSDEQIRQLIDSLR